jgi:hypothetical protein
MKGGCMNKLWIFLGLIAVMQALAWEHTINNQVNGSIWVKAWGFGSGSYAIEVKGNQQAKLNVLGMCTDSITISVISGDLLGYDLQFRNPAATVTGNLCPGMVITVREAIDGSSKNQFGSQVITSQLVADVETQGIKATFVSPDKKTKIVLPCHLAGVVKEGIVGQV